MTEQPVAVGDHVKVGRGKKVWRVERIDPDADGPIARLAPTDGGYSKSSATVARCVRVDPTSGPESAPGEGTATPTGSEPAPDATPGEARVELGSGPEPDPPGIEPPVRQVQASHSDRLAQLHASYPELKARAAEAEAALKACKDAIKFELTQADPNATRFDLVGDAAPPLRLTYSESWRFDSRTLKRDAAGNPDLAALYVKYAKKSGSWTLTAGGGEG